MHITLSILILCFIIYLIKYFFHTFDQGERQKLKQNDPKLSIFQSSSALNFRLEDQCWPKKEYFHISHTHTKSMYCLSYFWKNSSTLPPSNNPQNIFYDVLNLSWEWGAEMILIWFWSGRYRKKRRGLWKWDQKKRPIREISEYWNKETQFSKKNKETQHKITSPPRKAKD